MMSTFKQSFGPKPCQVQPHMEAEMQSNSGVIPLSNIIYFIPLISLGSKDPSFSTLYHPPFPGTRLSSSLLSFRFLSWHMKYSVLLIPLFQSTNYSATKQRNQVSGTASFCFTSYKLFTRYIKEELIVKIQNTIFFMQTGCVNSKERCHSLFSLFFFLTLKMHLLKVPMTFPHFKPSTESCILVSVLAQLRMPKKGIKSIIFISGK